MEGLAKFLSDFLRRLFGGPPADRPPSEPAPVPSPPEPEPAPEVPAGEPPVGESPSDESPVEEVPADVPSDEEAPGDAPETPPEETPVEESPTEETPADEPPTDEAPVEESPPSEPESPESETPAPPSAEIPADTAEEDDASPSAPPVVESAPEVDAAPCRATIRPELSVVNIRSGPGLSFNKVVRASGGQDFGVGGVSGVDPDGFPWYWIDWDGGSGWIRSDLVALTGDCAALEPVEPLPPEPPASPPPSSPEGRFPLPVPDALTQGYHNAHKGYDLGAPLGRELRAFTEGVVIRRVDCTACTSEKPNVLPSSLTQAERDVLFADPAWGFGYGNFITVRYAYGLLPQALRQEMDALGLTDGFAYILFAHMSRVDVHVGDRVLTGTLLGLTGNTGHSSGPHLHMEVKVGRVQTVDGVWLQQTAVHPNLLFMDNP